MKTKFPAHRQKFTFFMLFVGILILGSPALALFFDPEAINNFSYWMILFPGSFFFFFAYVLIASAFKMFIIYQFTSGGLKIYKPPFHNKLFHFRDIESVELLDAETSAKIIEESILEQNSFAEHNDLIGYINHIKRNSPIYKYYTIAAQVKTTQIGPKDLITSINVKKTEATILLKLKDGHFHFLTPAEPIEFKQMFDKLNA